jgi:hypothetical protein
MVMVMVIVVVMMMMMTMKEEKIGLWKDTEEKNLALLG